MTGDTRDRLAAVVHGVVFRWWSKGLIRFGSHDDGSDDLLIASEAADRLIAAGFGDTAALTAEVERLKLELDRALDAMTAAHSFVRDQEPTAAMLGAEGILRYAIREARAALGGPADATGGGR